MIALTIQRGRQSERKKEKEVLGATKWSSYRALGLSGLAVSGGGEGSPVWRYPLHWPKTALLPPAYSIPCWCHQWTEYGLLHVMHHIYIKGEKLGMIRYALCLHNEFFCLQTGHDNYERVLFFERHLCFVGTVTGQTLSLLVQTLKTIQLIQYMPRHHSQNCNGVADSKNMCEWQQDKMRRV